MSLPPFNHASGYKLTANPNPSWKPGDGLGDTESAREWRAAEEKGWTIVDPEKLNKPDLYRLMTTGIIARPIAFVSSLSENGIPNLAPFSWFNMLTHEPPLVMFSASRLAGKDKDTTANIRCNKDFTVNIISEPWADAAHFTCINAPSDVSEWVGSGLTMEKSTIVRPAWVRESAFAMECEVHQIVDIPSAGGALQCIIIGLVKLIHVRNAVLTPTGAVDPGLLKPLLRLGEGLYAKLGEGFYLKRPMWSEYEDQVRELENKGKVSNP